MEDLKSETQILDPVPVKNKNIGILVLGIVLFVLSITSSFAAGYYLNHFVEQNKVPVPSSTPTPQIQPVDEGGVETDSVVLPGKAYYDDTILAITHDNPKKIIVATATRQELEKGSNQATRVSYFDGDHWARKILTKQYDTTGIYTNNLISKWKIDIDPSRVLKQKVQGTLNVEQNTLTFDTGTITNNISVRSLPGFTKFMSTSNGNVNINGQSTQADILYTRIYSNNSQDLQFYETPFDLTTHWLAFWDNDGNFYHIDSTKVDKPTTKYQTHQFGVLVDTEGRVSKTFNVSIETDAENPPHTYQIQLGNPINKTLTFTTEKSINKAPNNAYSWFMSNGSGQIDNQTNGYGVVEYIHH